MIHTLVLVVHVTAGVAGLLLGVPAMRAALAGRRTRATAAYEAAVAVLTATALGLAVMAWSSLWPFAFLALATEAAVLAAGWTRRRLFQGWLPWHVRLLCGSYVSLVTAVFVVSWGSLAAWLLPIVVGSALVERAAVRARAPEAQTRPA